MEPTDRVLITGATGLLGRALTAEARARGLEVFPLHREELDVTDPEAVDAALHDAAPGVVFNCAAFSNVDAAESEPRKALAVNRDGARNVAEAAAREGALMVHISTDYVFDGRKESPYLPTDQPAPLNRYGISKLAGEMAVREAAPEHLIVRTSWLFGEGSAGFVGFVRRALDAPPSDCLTIVSDEWSRPTWVADLAPALLELVEKGARGCLHLANAGSCSRLELALEIRSVLGSEITLCPVPAEEFGAPARRPHYSVLDLSDGERILGRALPHWGEALRRFLSA